jgi:hypothetical protein
MSCQSLHTEGLQDVNYLYGYKTIFNGVLYPLKNADKVASDLVHTQTRLDAASFVKEDLAKDKKEEIINDMVLPTSLQPPIGGGPVAGKCGGKEAGKCGGKEPAKPKSMFKVKSQFKSKYF